MNIKGVYLRVGACCVKSVDDVKLVLLEVGQHDSRLEQTLLLLCVANLAVDLLDPPLVLTDVLIEVLCLQCDVTNVMVRVHQCKSHFFKLTPPNGWWTQNTMREKKKKRTSTKKESEKRERGRVVVCLQKNVLLRGYFIKYRVKLDRVGLSKEKCTFFFFSIY